MNTGLPRHLTVSDMPGSTPRRRPRSRTAASVEASGRIWSMKGHAKAPAPTTPAMPVAMYRKSRRVGSIVSLRSRDLESFRLTPCRRSSLSAQLRRPLSHGERAGEFLRHFRLVYARSPACPDAERGKGRLSRRGQHCRPLSTARRRNWNSTDTSAEITHTGLSAARLLRAEPHQNLVRNLVFTDDVVVPPQAAQLALDEIVIARPRPPASAVRTRSGCLLSMPCSCCMSCFDLASGAAKRRPPFSARIS